HYQTDNAKVLSDEANHRCPEARAHYKEAT
ncbi:MAG: hypothetical protein ACI8Z9_001496, partial [Paraglaciecola sp.]